MKKETITNFLIVCGFLFIVLGLPTLIALVITWGINEMNNMTFIEYLLQTGANVSKSIAYFCSRLI